MIEIPTFKTDKEAAEWFDTHDTAPYMDSLEKVKERIVVIRSWPPAGSLGVRLPAEYLEAIKKAADRKGVPFQMLIQTWLAEKLEQEVPDLMPR